MITKKENQKVMQKTYIETSEISSVTYKVTELPHYLVTVFLNIYSYTILFHLFFSFTTDNIKKS